MSSEMARVFPWQVEPAGAVPVESDVDEVVPGSSPPSWRRS